MTKKPIKNKEIITQTFNVQPEQGFAMMAANLIPPEGYFFVSMERKGTKAVVTYRLIEQDQGATR